MDPRRSQVPLQRFFAGLAEYAFHTRLGVADPQLVDYISGLLTRFVHVDAIHKVRNPAGRRLVEVTEMLAEADARVGAPRREVHRHIGDYTLFWTGVYPEVLLGRKHASRVDVVIDYREQGKRSYHIASTLEPADESAPDSHVLERLSHDFDLCAYGLGEVRREWERREGPEGLEPGRPIILE